LLFDPRPKARREDLYDFDEELERFVKALGEPMILVSGLRRTGKTSLILTSLSVSGAPFIYFDLREGARSYADLYKLVSRGFTEFVKRWSGLRSRFLEALSRVRGVSIAGVEVSFSWSPRKRPLLSELLDAVNDFAERIGSRIAVVFDELQSVRGSMGVALQSALAHSYDFNKSVTLVLAGSEMGVLYSILQNPESPLYGRAYVEVRTRKLSYSEAVDFLTKGFEEAGATVSRGEVEEAVRELDGIIGWLAYYGYLRSRGMGSVEQVVREAIALAKKELEAFLLTRVSSRYRAVLRALAQGVREWGELKRELERLEKREVSDRVVHDVLVELKRHSIVDESNEFTDPVYRRASLEL